MRDERLEGGSACYRTCSLSGGAGASGCGGAERCIAATGHEVCAPNDSPLVTGGTVPAPTSAPVEDAKDEQPFVPITPKLGVPIPGVTLTPASEEGGSVSVPFLAQYINGVYRYLVTIVLIISIIMVVYGGFRYLIGSSIGDIQTGKKIIVDSLVGMLIVLGAYMILNTVNPATLNLKMLSVPFISRIDIDTQLLNTQVDTIDPVDAAPSGGVPSPLFADCPLELSAPSTEPPQTGGARRSEFNDEIGSVSGGATSRIRVRQIAEAASKCGVWMGSCGSTAEEVYELAGSARRGRQTHTVQQSHFPLMRSLKCAEYSRDCTTNAATQVFSAIQAANPGWPNSWARELQPGDVITIYNANSDGYGLHRAIFMGFAGNGKAEVIDGAYKRFVRSHQTCITTDCPNPWPLIRTFQPDP